jgi:hypothetical protein
MEAVGGSNPAPVRAREARALLMLMILEFEDFCSSGSRAALRTMIEVTLLRKVLSNILLISAAEAMRAAMWATPALLTRTGFSSQCDARKEERKKTDHPDDYAWLQSPLHSNTVIICNVELDSFKTCFWCCFEDCRVLLWLLRVSGIPEDSLHSGSVWRGSR